MMAIGDEYRYIVPAHILEIQDSVLYVDDDDDPDICEGCRILSKHIDEMQWIIDTLQLKLDAANETIKRAGGGQLDAKKV